MSRPGKVGDDEEQYFRALEAEQRAALRKKMENAAKDLMSREETAKAAGTDDLDLAGQIRTLGFEGDSAKIFDLVPLVAVAWADDSIQRDERATILRVLEARGITPGSEAFVRMEALLEEKPSAPFFERSLSVLRRVLSSSEDDRTQDAKDLVELSSLVASASGGFFGLMKQVSHEEKDCLHNVAQALGVEKLADIQKLLR